MTKENGNEWFLSAQSYDQNEDNIPDILIGGRDAELQLINGSNGILFGNFGKAMKIQMNTVGIIFIILKLLMI